MEKNNKIDWGNISNKKINENLISIKHEHIALKNKIIKLMEVLEDIEKDYYLGNTILGKRIKGEK
tara:strand:+ start:5033 stop:5227 length:195 start_codon:yes stop_codon:yes gene_type:complete